MLHTHHIAFESFWVSGALIFASLVYLRGWLRPRRHEHDNGEGWRAASFVFGLLFIWIATASPLAALDHDMLTAHMVLYRLSWKWRERSSGKIAERTYEKRTEALHC